jgi:hypothetical protein
MTPTGKRSPWRTPAATAAVVVASMAFVARCSLSAAGPGCRSVPGGYWLARADGEVTPVGGAVRLGGMTGRGLSAPIAAIAATPSRGGYWLLGADGGVFAFGDAGFFGSAVGGGDAFVDLVPTPTGAGYWLVTAAGAVRAFGDADGDRPASPPGGGAAPKVIGMASAQPAPGGC